MAEPKTEKASGGHAGKQRIRVHGNDFPVCDNHLDHWQEYANVKGASLEQLGPGEGTCAGDPPKYTKRPESK